VKQAKALLVMTLVARRSAAWAHDVVTSGPINDGEVSDDAIQRYAKDIMDALTILTDPERGNWAAPPEGDGR
jgi:hypothetical protein